MERRAFLKSVATTGALLITTGCIGGSSESQPAADTEAGSGTDNNMIGGTTTEVEPAEVPSPRLTFRVNSGVLRVVHMGGEKVTNEGTDEVYVIVDDECTATWVADDDKGGEFPVSVGSFLEIESVESGSMVEIVWVGSRGAEEILVTHKVGAGETVTATTTDKAATNEATTNETTTNETTTATATETTTSSGDETGN